VHPAEAEADAAVVVRVAEVLYALVVLDHLRLLDLATASATSACRGRLGLRVWVRVWVRVKRRVGARVRVRVRVGVGCQGEGWGQGKGWGQGEGWAQGQGESRVSSPFLKTVRKRVPALSLPCDL